MRHTVCTEDKGQRSISDTTVKLCTLKRYNKYLAKVQ